MRPPAEGFLLSSARISLPTGFLSEGIKVNPSTLFTSGGRWERRPKRDFQEYYIINVLISGLKIVSRL